MAGTIIETKALTKRYGALTAVDDLNLTVRQGEVFGLLGPNGAGKTTTTLMLLGLTEPTAGSASISGVDCTRNPIQVKRFVGYLPDNMGFYPDMTGRQNLRMTGAMNGLSGDYLEARIDELVARVGMTEAVDRRAGTYSKGMKQRLGLAAALLGYPKLLILDEPTNGLDPIGIAEVRDFIRALCDERGKTILISSHILSEIALLADDIGIIDHGVLLEEESLAELEQKNGKVLRFTVSNAPVAAQLLQREMGVREVSVENERDLTVRDLRLDTGAAVRRFVEAGLVVSDAHLYEDTLEDYFKRITGGEGIA